MKTSKILFLTTIIAALSNNLAIAGAKERLLNCWDGSFAYTRLTVTKEESGLLTVLMVSQDHRVFNNLIPDERWGVTTMEFKLNPNDCQSVLGPEEVMSCRAEKTASINLNVSRFEKENPRENTLVEGLIFSIHSGEEFVIDLSFTKLNSVDSSQSATNLHWVFPLSQGKCIPFDGDW